MRKMPFRYSLLCGNVFNAEDTEISENPKGFILSSVKLAELLHLFSDLEYQ